MKIRQFLLGLGIVTLTIVAPISMTDRASAASTDLVFVVSAEAPIQSLSVDDIQNIYLGKKRLVGSFPVSAVDHSETEPIKQAFLEFVLHMTHAQYREQLMRRHFQEGAVTPKFVANASEALNAVRETPGAIGYVYESEAGTLLGLKVIATVPGK
jgi:ABC-type phosphate transport system substrate-binding protein